MDALGLQTLASELETDVVVVVAAIDLAGLRFAEATPSGHDSAAHHLSRAYNVIEQMALRVARVFENNVDDPRGWHTELIRRLSIRIAGVRPPLFTAQLRQPLQELRAFRHVFVHAYDLTIDPERLRLGAFFLPLPCSRRSRMPHAETPKHENTEDSSLFGSETKGFPCFRVSVFPCDEFALRSLALARRRALNPPRAGEG